MAIITIQKDGHGCQIDTYIDSDGNPIIKIDSGNETLGYVFADHREVDFFIGKLKEIRDEYEINNQF